MINFMLQPPIANTYDDSLARVCIDLAQRWKNAKTIQDLAQFASSDLHGFSSGQVVIFLEELDHKDDRLSHDHLQHLFTVYHMGKRTNCEIRYRWYLVCLSTLQLH
jgi:leukotriene-A4 hydrolase